MIVLNWIAGACFPVMHAAITLTQHT